MSEGFDPLLRELIPAFPGDFVWLLAPTLAPQLDLEALTFLREEYFMPNPRGGRPRRPDLVGAAKVLGQDDEVLLHVELEARFRSDRVSKLYDYNPLLRLSTGRRVHSMVVYCRGGPAGVQERTYKEMSLGEEVGRLAYRSLGLSRCPAVSLLERPERLAWAFAALAKPARGQSRAQLRMACLERIVQAPDLAEDKRFRLFNFVATCIESGENPVDEYEALRRKANQEVANIMLTWADKIELQGIEKGREEGIEKGREEGIEKGREEGIEKGREEGLTTLQGLALKVLEDRFSRVPKRISTAVRSIRSTSKLTEIVRKAAVANSLADVGI